MLDQSGFLRALEGDEGAPLWARFALAGLAPVGWFWGDVMRLRRSFYEAGFGSGAQPACPVISVGNLTLGGTGKTPAVAWLLSRLLEGGERPAMVSRGYGGAGSGVRVVSKGQGDVLSSPPASDEAVLMARMFPSVPVVTGKDRPAAARRAEEIGAGVIVVDDGFQHLALRRCFDLVVLRGDRPFGNGRMFPSGSLREPLGSLQKAGAILITGEAAPGIREKVAVLIPETKIFEGRLAPSALVDLSGSAAGKLDDLRGVGIVAVSGIGNPDGFLRTLVGLGANILKNLAFPDHAVYGENEVARIAAAVKETGAELAVATEKDAVKLVDLSGAGFIRALRVEMEIVGGGELGRIILNAAGRG